MAFFISFHACLWQAEVSLPSEGKVRQPCKGFWEGMGKVLWMRFPACVDASQGHVTKDYPDCGKRTLSVVPLEGNGVCQTLLLPA